MLHVDCEDPSKSITKGQSVRLATQLAHVFRHTYGIGRNGPSSDVVLVVTTGHYMLQTLFFATISADGVYSAASPASTVSELSYLIALVEPKILICNANTKAVVEETAKKIKFPFDRVLFLGGTPDLDLHVVGSGKKLQLSLSKTLSWTRVTDLKTLEDSTICILFSSGTTGFPKGVKISHRMMVAETFLTGEPDKAYNARVRPGWEYRTLAHLPAAHVAGVQGYFASTVYRGGTAFWMARFDFEKFLAYIKKYKITFFFTVPPIWLAVAKHPGVKDHFDMVTDASSGAAPLGAQLQIDAEAKLFKGQGRLTQVWGLTETTGAITAMEPGQRDHTGSVGPLVANHEARIVDDDAKDLPPGVAGEVWVRGPVVVKGYWKNEKANQESFVDGWFCTGDIGVFKEGKLYIVDRKKVCLTSLELTCTVLMVFRDGEIADSLHRNSSNTKACKLRRPNSKSCSLPIRRFWTQLSLVWMETGPKCLGKSNFPILSRYDERALGPRHRPCC